jgi:hypothetical protein
MLGLVWPRDRACRGQARPQSDQKSRMTETFTFSWPGRRAMGAELAQATTCSRVLDDIVQQLVVAAMTGSRVRGGRLASVRRRRL